MIEAGEIRDWAEAARLCGVTRARMSQISGLLLLCPAVQEALLDLPPFVEGRETVTERVLRPVAANTDWKQQSLCWRKLRHTPPSADCKRMR